MIKHSDYINYVLNLEYDKNKGLYTMHLANTFSQTEYHLTISVELFEAMKKKIHEYESKVNFGEVNIE